MDGEGETRVRGGRGEEGRCGRREGGRGCRRAVSDPDGVMKLGQVALSRDIGEGYFAGLGARCGRWDEKADNGVRACMGKDGEGVDA